MMELHLLHKYDGDTMNLGIQSQICNQCKHETYPPSSVSKVSEKTYKIEHKYNLKIDKDKDKLKVDDEIKELEKVTKKATRIDKSDTEVDIDVERYESILEGDSQKGRLVCPNCGFAFVSWFK